MRDESRGRRLSPTRHLDDDAGVIEQEVDPGERPRPLAVHDLGAWARKSGLAHETEEGALERRVTTGVREQPVDKTDPSPSGTPMLRQAVAQHGR